ncbi:MAG: hypothetical protein WCI65_11145, partial [Synechococcaceae cyanobacterium ELA263]
GVFQIKVIQHLLPSDPPLARLLGFPRSPKDYHPLGPRPSHPYVRHCQSGQFQPLTCRKGEIAAW